MPAVRKSANKSKRGAVIRKPGTVQISASKRADTLFPVGRLNRLLRQGRYAERQGSSAGAFMAAVLEYLTAEILELAGEVCLAHKKKTIQPKHLNLALRGDGELAQLTAMTTISEGSVLHHVEHTLFAKPKKGGKGAVATQEV